MNKSILMWGAPDRVEGSKNYQDAFLQSGRNFGNILIGHGVRSVLDGEVIGRNDVPTPEHANERCSHVVIPAANFLWKDFDFGYMADYLEKTVLPVTIIGVGAQTNDRSVSSPIHPNTLRLMQLIADRSAYIGVRGFYTAEVLAANGIYNVQVIGCPSLYMNRSPSIRIDTGLLRDLTEVSVNFSRRVNGHAFSPPAMKRIENAVLKFAMQRKSTFIAQDELEELSLQSSDEGGAPITHYFDELDAESVIEFFRTRTRYFTNVDSWAKDLRARSASVGSRFHGNLLALINGIPALTVVHDSRTMEMCTMMGIPRIHICQMTEREISPQAIEEALTSANYSLFEKAYAHLYKKFAGFLNANGLRHTLVAP